MDSLFGSVPARQFPPQRLRRAPRPRDRHAQRYGPSNPPIFTVVLREPPRGAAPIVRDRPRYALEDKDPWGEWRNPHDPAHAQTVYHLLRLPMDYDVSVGFIRGRRPDQPNAALRFWRSPVARAHLLNALLGRGDRTIAQLHRDMRLKHQGSGRLHEYLHRWGVVWARPDRLTDVVDGDGVTYPARVTTLHHGQGSATLRLDDYLLTVDARFDRLSRVYRTASVLDMAQLVPLTVAASVLGLTAAGALAVLPITTESAPARVPLVSPAHMVATMPASAWRVTVTDALRDANPCRCAFWNHHAGACGLDHATLPDPGTAAYACEDHADA